VEEESIIWGKERNEGKKEDRRVKMRERIKNGGNTTERGIGKQRGKETNKGVKVRKRL
jgi:hypothetical protein